MIPRYALPEMAELFTDEARFATWLEVELLAVEAWAKLGVVPPADAEAIRERADFDRSEAVDERGAGHRPRRRRLRRRGPGARRAPAGAWLHYGLTSSDVVDTALVGHARPGVRPLLDAVDDARGGDRGPGPRAPRHADGRAHPRRPRRARPRSGPSSRCGPCSCAATASASRGPATPIAVGKLSGAVGTYSNVDPEVEAYVCEQLGLHAGAGHPGDRPRPPRRVPVRVRVGRGASIEAFATRDPPPPAHRGARGRGAVPRRRAEGLERDAAQAQPGEGASSSAAWRACCAATCRPGSRTSRSGTSATSRTRRSSASSSPTRCSSRTTCSCSSGRSSRACACIPSACCENLDASYGLVFSQPVLLALVESGLHPRRRVPRSCSATR